jgi:hypothetical protein
MKKIVLFWISNFIAAVFLLYWPFSHASRANFSDFALGKETQTVIGTVDGDRVHCFDMAHADDCIVPARNRDLRFSILWLGNSQLHAINQAMPTDLPASSIAASALRYHGADLITFSQPNANLVEHWILFEALVAVHSFDFLLLPVVFDDMREQNLRPDIEAVLSDPSLKERFESSELGQRVLETLTPIEDNVSSVTLQKASEAWITSVMERCCGWETLRSQVRGKISIFLYKFRNFVFGINASSIRRMLPAAYSQNIEALDAILEAAHHHDVEVILYIPPLRDDAPAPYDATEYATFLDDISAKATLHGAHFYNIEGLVPGALWGLKDSTTFFGEPELDFMHFQLGGHLLLADWVYNVVLETVNDF